MIIIIIYLFNLILQIRINKNYTIIGAFKKLLPKRFCLWKAKVFTIRLLIGKNKIFK